jgi:putative transposase
MTELFSRPPRLAEYDYTQPGAYFITINTHKKNNLSGYLANNSVDLNIFGIIASSCWREIPVHFANTQLDEFIFMPNHMHGIIWIAVSGDTACCVSTEKQQGNLEKFGKPVTRLIHREKEDLRIWQSNYFEHVIRNNDDLDKTREYIHYNAFNRLDI